MNSIEYDYKNSQLKFSDSKGRQRNIKFILDRENKINVFFGDITSLSLNETLWINMVALVIAHYRSEGITVEMALEKLVTDLERKEFLFFESFDEYQNPEQIFTNIYDKAIWGSNNQGRGCSGIGSTVECAEPYMKFLQDFLKYNEIRTIVDAGCGDWTFSQHINWEERCYVGIDVVKHVIERNQEKFSSPTISFIHGNATTLELPPADLLLCKDVLQHLPNEEILLFLSTIHKFKYCLISNDFDLNPQNNNKQVTLGKWRPLDLTKPPFNVLGTKVLTYEMPNSNLLSQTLCIRNPI